MTGFDRFLDFPLQFDFGSFQCYDCNVSFTDVDDALKHLTGHLPKDFDKDVQNNENAFENVEYQPPEVSNEDQTQRDQKYLEMLHQPNETACPQCDKTFNTLAAWGAHFQSVHEMNKFDDIPVSTSGENGQDNDFDPPSPVYMVRNIERIRSNSFSDTISVSTSDENVLPAYDAQMAIEKKDESPKESFD